MVQCSHTMTEISGTTSSNPHELLAGLVPEAGFCPALYYIVMHFLMQPHLLSSRAIYIWLLPFATAPAAATSCLQDPVHSKYLVKEAILPFMHMGGVRIEDNVVVTAGGSLSLTDVPRTVEEIEAVMAGSPWPFGGVKGVAADDMPNSIAGVSPAPGLEIM